MSEKNSFDFDIDSILAEFTDFSAGLLGDESEKASVGTETACREAQTAPQTYAAPEEAHTRPAPFPPAYGGEEYGRFPQRPAAVGGDDLPPRSHSTENHNVPSRRRDPDSDDRARRRDPDSGDRAPRRQPAPRRREAYEDDVFQSSRPGREVKSLTRPPKSRLIKASLLFSALLALVLLWVVLAYHPDSGSRSADAASRAKVDMVSRMDTYIKNLSARTVPGIDGPEGTAAVVLPHYDALDDGTLAPRPDASHFITLSADRAEEVLPVIQQARDYGLLDGQDVIFDPHTDFYWDSDIECYCDETILVICWKEQINQRVCSCVEVKIADGSQLRRKLSGDYFGSGVQDYATSLARSSNAVVAMNADFYAFRSIGSVIYNGEISRFDTSCDLLLIGPGGDFDFMYAKDIGSRESLQQYINDNDIRFGLAFGPVIIDDGEVKRLPTDVAYAKGMGEMWEEYSRAGIGQYDRLHYLYISVNHSTDGTPRANVNEFADIMYSKGISNAYNLDGGQTAEVVFNDKFYNHVDYGYERLVSDIIYFATAVPEKEETP